MNKCLFLILISYIFVSCSQKLNLEKPDFNTPNNIKGLKLVWHDEFNCTGQPDSNYWKSENGFVRNEELQWYQPQNAFCKNGVLTIEAQRTNIPNPNFIPGSKDWRTNRSHITFTSSSIQTRGLKEWQFGTFIIRAKIDTTQGSWPAIWTLGTTQPWPSNGEIDIMEFYRIKNVPTILANFAWGTTKQYVAKWDDAKIPLTHFTEKNKNWVNEFHIWRMDWSKNAINIYLDNELINSTNLSETVNPDGFNPFLQSHYLLLNLAIGGINGGTPYAHTQSIKYEVDYVRVYQSYSGDSR